MDSNGKKYLATNFQSVFHTWYGKLHRYAHTLLKDPDEASDAVQAVFSRLWEKMEELKDLEDIGPYLYRSVHNHCLNRIRKEGNGKKYADWLARHDAGTTGDAGAKLAVAELSARIGEALDALPPQCRLIFTLSREQGKKYAEIAETLSLSVKTVETQMSKALRILREKLADYIALGGAAYLYIDKLLS
ncbi:RNA polymerase sigma-70 factor [Chitinophaga caseinilytica]|uniref:RNA polymerase sigma-70 factor n=1 Tax=Chitinophaga caseinilytica TaxID=2267521 RepID=UPI003C2CFDF8